MSDLVLMPMTRKEFLGLDISLRRRILARQATLHLINQSKSKCTACGAPYAPVKDDNGLCVKCSLKPNPAAEREQWERDAKEAP